eukprot:4643634-Karenia_brevis.AAC.1
MEDLHGTEVRNRIAQGRASFSRFRDELCGKHYNFRDKLRLFESVVTSRVMYGSAAWTLTSGLEHELRVARRRMLRLMFGGRRKVISNSDTESTDSDASTSSSSASGNIINLDDQVTDELEPWADFVQRVTHHIESITSELSLDDW